MATVIYIIEKFLHMDILYIEDDLIDQIAFIRVLKNDKTIDCHVASDLTEAEQLIQNFKFDLILSDYYLAGDTIEDVMSKFKNHPIFLLSGTENMQMIQALYKNGLKGHYQKPFSKNDLLYLLSEKTTKVVPKKTRKVADFNQPIQFDFTFVKNIIKDSQDLKKELIQIFINLGTTEIARLRQNIKAPNRKIIGQSTHKLKSNLRMMGLSQLLIKAQEIETMCNEEIEEVCLLNQEVQNFVERLEKAVHAAKVVL